MLKWLWISVLVIILDQVTKAVAVDVLQFRELVPILPVFGFTLAYNTGAAFSFLSDAGGWQRWFFSVIAIAVSVFLVLWLKKLKEYERWQAIALALILGGALGNLYDRVVLGHVVDFLLLHYQDNYFPAFNIADTAISMGAVMLVIDMFRKPQQQ
ncbi:signal peptidase II [Endozoicomonas sp. SM1973]|uniref:Lipoprotein signal peptidase n=1 Tax=Spartinivicinus marinus TaxID=2994442 RepID=A0A853ICR4_9GAMM|nr:signal peptidase II [Spartinivicinus marinus]MCX4025595.1 signal peptidase II [Spartinivicinus marinus]NYZ65176.1 signal peptidase II [Spartinivicinus marinus]